MSSNARPQLVRQEPKRGTSNAIPSAAAKNRPKQRHVFISHKAKDEKIARILREYLVAFGGGKLKCFVSEEIPLGNRWEEQIYAKLQAADYLILVYTDPETAWDWCLYETGFFVGCRGKEGKKPICLHADDASPPNPLKRWKSVSLSNVEELIKEILNYSKDVSSNLIQEAAHKIQRSFQKRSERQVFTKSVDLILNDSQLRDLGEQSGLPQEAKVRGTAEAFSVLNVMPKRNDEDWTWGQLLQELPEDPFGSWNESLGNLIADAARCKGICPGLPVFKSPKDKKTYCPVLSSLEDSGGQYTFKLDFVELPDEDNPATYGTIGPIANLMKLSQRVRFGLIELYKSKVKELAGKNATEAEITNVLNRLRSAMLKISAEARMLHVFSTENVKSAFNDPKDREEVNRITNEWAMARDRLFNEYIPHQDLQGVLGVLDEMRRHNRDFMLMVSKREHELLLEME